VTRPAKCSQVAPVVVGRVSVDVVPVKPPTIAATLAVLRLGVQTNRLASPAVRGVRAANRSRTIRNPSLRTAYSFLHRLGSRGARDRITFTLRSARKTVGRISGDRRPAIGAAFRPLTVLASGLHTGRSSAAFGERGQWFRFAAKAARLHWTSLPECHDYCRLAAWRTTDPGQLAQAAQVEKPPTQVAGQDTLFEVMP
jgi:hypothetical protein